jgi:hypothetical protein
MQNIIHPGSYDDDDDEEEEDDHRLWMIGINWMCSDTNVVTKMQELVLSRTV